MAENTYPDRYLDVGFSPGVGKKRRRRRPLFDPSILRRAVGRIADQEAPDPRMDREFERYIQEMAERDAEVAMRLDDELE